MTTEDNDNCKVTTPPSIQNREDIYYERDIFTGGRGRDKLQLIDIRHLKYTILGDSPIISIG
jgi:hypothetical protein